MKNRSPPTPAPKRARGVHRAERAPMPAPVPGLRLGRAVRAEPRGWRLSFGGEEVVASVDPCVATALLEEAARSGARVVVERTESGGHTVVGLLTTERAVTIDRAGDVQAQVRRWKVVASDEVLMQAPGSFLQLKLSEAELYANRVVCRARELTRLLGRMIKLN